MPFDAIVSFSCWSISHPFLLIFAPTRLWIYVDYPYFFIFAKNSSGHTFFQLRYFIWWMMFYFWIWRNKIILKWWLKIGSELGYYHIYSNWQETANYNDCLSCRILIIFYCPVLFLSIRGYIPKNEKKHLRERTRKLSRHWKIVLFTNFAREY